MELWDGQLKRNLTNILYINTTFCFSTVIPKIHGLFFLSQKT